MVENQESYNIPPVLQSLDSVPLRSGRQPYVSKSKYISGLQCHKLLWFYYNAKNQIPPVDAGTQAIFDQGHLVGELAKKLYPEGIEVARDVDDLDKILELSKEALHFRKPLFEAAFRYENAYARVDVLNPVGKDEWEIVEVKSSTHVKDVNLHDLALQRYVYEGAGLTISRCYIMLINNQFIRKGDIEPKKLFKKVNVTRKVQVRMKTVRSDLKEMVDVIDEKSYPDIKIGPHCNDPYGCALQDLCWKFLPRDNPLTLYYFKEKKAFDLIHSGYLDVRKLPATVDLSDKQQVQIETLRSGQPHIDRKEIRAFLKGLRYPLFYLDFETFGTAIPLFDNVKPYEQIPFQYSLHTVKAKGEEPTHEGFLADGKTDPRPIILERLQKSLSKRGSILAFNAGFEKDKLRKACGIFKEYAKWFEKNERRFVDLLSPFRSFYYYHPDQCGSASIKAVLPSLTGVSYEGLQINDGGAASQEYLRVTFGDVVEQERVKVRGELEKYCQFDTKAMVLIVEKLGELLEAK